MDEAIDIAHTQVEEETDIQTEKIKHNSRTLQIILLVLLLLHVLIIIWQSTRMYSVIENEQTILLTISTSDLLLLLESALVYEENYLSKY